MSRSQRRRVFSFVATVLVLIGRNVLAQNDSIAVAGRAVMKDGSSIGQVMLSIPNVEHTMMLQRLGVSDSNVSADELRAKLAWRGPGLFDRLIALKDSLALTPAQTDSLAVWSARHAAYRDSTYSSLSAYLAGRQGEYASQAVQQRWHEAIAAVRWHEWGLGAALRSLLTERQWRIVAEDTAPTAPRFYLMDREEVERVIARWFMAPA